MAESLEEIDINGGELDASIRASGKLTIVTNCFDGLDLVVRRKVSGFQRSVSDSRVSNYVRRGISASRRSFSFDRTEPIVAVVLREDSSIATNRDQEITVTETDISQCAHSNMELSKSFMTKVRIITAKGSSYIHMKGSNAARRLHRSLGSPSRRLYFMSPLITPGKRISAVLKVSLSEWYLACITGDHLHIEGRTEILNAINCILETTDPANGHDILRETLISHGFVEAYIRTIIQFGMKCPSLTRAAAEGVLRLCMSYSATKRLELSGGAHCLAQVIAHYCPKPSLENDRMCDESGNDVFRSLCHILWRLVFATASDGIRYASMWTTNETLPMLLDSLTVQPKGTLFGAVTSHEVGWQLAAVRLLICRGDQETIQRMVDFGIIRLIVDKIAIHNRNPWFAQNALASLVALLDDDPSRVSLLDKAHNHVWDLILKCALEYLGHAEVVVHALALYKLVIGFKPGHVEASDGIAKVCDVVANDNTAPPYVKAHVRVLQDLLAAPSLATVRERTDGPHAYLRNLLAKTEKCVEQPRGARRRWLHLFTWTQRLNKAMYIRLPRLGAVA